MFKELKEIAFIISVFDKFERKGLITWRQKDKILIIEVVLAVMKLADGRKGFQNFLNQAAIWQNERIISEAYEARRIKIETSAVRKAQKDYAHLTKADIHRIRQKARENMEMIPLERLDCIKEFDIFIIRSNAPSIDRLQRQTVSCSLLVTTTERRSRWPCTMILNIILKTKNNNETKN